MRRGGVALIVAASLTSCDFTSSATLNTCQQSIPAACGSKASCVLGGDEYLQGYFPGSRTFVIRTDTPRSVTFSFVFQDRRAAGTGLTLTSTEPDCSEQSSYASHGDLFELAGASGVLEFPIQMTNAGDHLVSLHSDAYCSYEMRYH